MNPEDLAELHRLVREADAFASRPLEEGETSRPITFFTSHLSDDGRRLGRRLVRAFRAQNPGLFLLCDEQSLYLEALERLAAASAVPTIDQLAEALEASAKDEEGKWLICIPAPSTSSFRPQVHLSHRVCCKHSRLQSWGLVRSLFVGRRRTRRRQPQEKRDGHSENANRNAVDTSKARGASLHCDFAGEPIDTGSDACDPADTKAETTHERRMPTYGLS